MALFSPLGLVVSTALQEASSGFNGVSICLQALYQLQRGPMLGNPGAHPEEKALLQALFVNAAPLVALKMLAPSLQLLDRGSGQFNIMTPASIALWSGMRLLYPMFATRNDVTDKIGTQQ